MSIPGIGRPTAAGFIGVKTWDAFVRSRLDEARTVMVKGRTVEEALENLQKLMAPDERFMSISERPARYER